MPPMLAEKQIESIIIFFMFSVALMVTRTASRMGIIITVVAVLEIHMERKAVGIMKPSIT